MRNVLIIIFVFLFFKAGAQSSSALAVSNRADSLFEVGEYNKAIPYFLEKDRFYHLAKSYEALGNNMEAQRFYQKALLHNSSHPKTEFDYAKLLIKLSNYKKADSLLQNLQSQFPHNPNFLYERALLKEVQKDSTAIDFFLEVYNMDGKNVNAIYKIARNYIENRKFEASAPFIAKGLSENPNSIRFLTLRALKEFYTDEFHDAIATYNVLIRKGESYISLHENLAKAYAKTFQVEKAMEQYNILFIKFNDQNPQWHHEVAMLYRINKMYKEAEKHFNIAIGLLETPLSTEYYEFSKLYGWSKDYKKEMELLQKSISNNPNNEMALYYLAVAADNYFKDKNTVVKYYENYLKHFGQTGSMRILAKQRLSDLKKKIHFMSD